MRTQAKERPIRCAWATSAQMVRYHDEEWGVPVHDDLRLFEFLILEGAQAGLSWSTILNKRENYRRAFDRFDPKRVARYDRRKLRRCWPIRASSAINGKSLPRSKTPRLFFMSRKNSAALIATSGNLRVECQK
jgi:Methyladenine glycosylase